MQSILTKILNNKDNDKLLNFLKISKEDSNLKLEDPRSDKGFDQGGNVFFHEYGKLIPDKCKYKIYIYNIMINEETGKIFAVHMGRFTFIFRCDFKKSKLVNSDDFRIGYTLDMIDDIRMLGENWTYLQGFEDEQQEQLLWAYELTKE